MSVEHINLLIAAKKEDIKKTRDPVYKEACIKKVAELESEREGLMRTVREAAEAEKVKAIKAAAEKKLRKVAKNARYQQNKAARRFKQSKGANPGKGGKK